jgi:peptidoglycan-associated lipoprotein
MKNRRTSLIALAFLLVGTFTFLSTCKQNPPTTTEQAKPAELKPPETRVEPPPAPTPAPVQPSVLSEDLESLNRKGYLQDAFFDFDKADLRLDARTALATDAEWLKKYPSIQVLIEGHCDERGTSKYNLALGDRRANAAKEYLTSLGVDASRIRTVSYGKERPFCTASTEECWQQNRRGHFVITAK